MRLHVCTEQVIIELDITAIDEYVIISIGLYIASVYSPFFDRVGHPLHNITSPLGQLFTTERPYWHHPHVWDAI